MTAKEAQNILELEAPFSVAELKSAHKNALVTWFPAQFMSDRSKLTQALEKTALIHEAYEVLLANCEAEKAAAPNPFVEEALKHAYGQTPDSPSRAESQPYRAPVLEPQAPASVEPLPRGESSLSASVNSSESVPVSLRFEEPEPEGDAPASASLETVMDSSIPAPVANPFLHEIVPLKVASEAPKVELRGKSTSPLDASAPPEASGSMTSSLLPRSDSAITKVRPPKVIISPRLRGATVQPAMPVATMPVPLPPLSAPAPAVVPLPPPPAAPVIAPLVAPELTEEMVKAEAPAPAPVPVPARVPIGKVTPILVAPEVAPEPPVPKVEPEAKASELQPAPAPAPALTPSVIPPADEVAPATPEPVVELEAKAPENEPAPTPAPESSALIKAEVPAPEAPVVAPKAEAPEASPVLKSPEPAPAPTGEPVSSPVEKPETFVAEIAPPPSPAVVSGSPEPAPDVVPAPAPISAAEVPAEPAHSVPAAIAEEASAVEQAAHHAPAAPVAATPAAAANHAPAPIARPHLPSSANGKTKSGAEAEADDQPAGDHALVPALGDRYHPAEKEGSTNTDTTRHFPTRPFAPSSGTSPIHDEEKSSAPADKVSTGSPESMASPSPRSLSVGQRILRFFLAVLCVGGVGYGIFLVSQTKIGKDPWGKEPGSGGPMDRLNHLVLEKLKRDAEDGIARAQYDLAKAYQNGKGVEENPEEALKWFRKAAEQGHMDAQNAVGDAYRNGWGVPQDNAQALKWYRMAEATREEQRGGKEAKDKEKEEDLRLQ